MDTSFQGKFFCSQMQNFVQFLPLWGKNLFPSGVHIREISPIYNYTTLKSSFDSIRDLFREGGTYAPCPNFNGSHFAFLSWVGHVLTVFNPSLCRLCPFHVVVCCCFKAILLWDFTLMGPLSNLGNILPAHQLLHFCFFVPFTWYMV